MTAPGNGQGWVVQPEAPRDLSFLPDGQPTEAWFSAVAEPDVPARTESLADQPDPVREAVPTRRCRRGSCR